MGYDLSLKEICKFIKNDDSKVIENIDSLLGLILIFSTSFLTSPQVAVTAALAIVADLLGVKSELSKICKNILEQILRKKNKDSLQKYHRMQAAYYLITYTAFFEALERLIPELAKSVGLKPNEKLILAQTALEKIKKNNKKSVKVRVEDLELEALAVRLHLPHPIDDFESQKGQLIPLYEELSKGFLSFLECLAIWENLDERQRSQIKILTDSLPRRAWEYFRSQYFLLASKFEDFYVWSNLHEHEETKSYLKNMSAYVQRHAVLAEASKKTIDLGFTQLSEVIHLIPEQIEARRVNKVLEELERHYSNVVDEPVIKDRFVPKGGEVPLSFPKKGRTIDELHQVIEWLTGFDIKKLQELIDKKVTFETFFTNAKLNPNVHLITGVICGYRIEEIETPLTKQVRYLDKLVDELAKGRKMEKILRKAQK